MSYLLYLGIVLSSVTQSASNKAFYKALFQSKQGGNQQYRYGNYINQIHNNLIKACTRDEYIIPPARHLVKVKANLLPTLGVEFSPARRIITQIINVYTSQTRIIQRY